MKLNKTLKELTSKIDSLESEIKSIKKLLTKPKISVNIKSTKLNNFFCAPDKDSNGYSSVNKLTRNIGMNQNGIMTFKTKYINALTSTLYNGKDLSLSLDKNNGYVILHINRIRVKCWSYSRILANFHDKNQHYNLSVVKLEEMILNGDIKVKFNVSTIKDHGTQWCIAK